MEGQVFTLDIIRDWGAQILASKRKTPMDTDSKAAIKKLAKHYLKSGRAATMDEAVNMAASILR